MRGAVRSLGCRNCKHFTTLRCMAAVAFAGTATVAVAVTVTSNLRSRCEEHRSGGDWSSIFCKRFLPLHQHNWSGRDVIEVGEKLGEEKPEERARERRGFSEFDMGHESFFSLVRSKNPIGVNP